MSNVIEEFEKAYCADPTVDIVNLQEVWTTAWENRCVFSLVEKEMFKPRGWVDVLILLPLKNRQQLRLVAMGKLLTFPTLPDESTTMHRKRREAEINTAGDWIKKLLYGALLNGYYIIKADHVAITFTGDNAEGIPLEDGSLKFELDTHRYNEIQFLDNEVQVNDVHIRCAEKIRLKYNNNV